MNYGKKGVKKRQARLQAVGPRWGNKLGLLAIELIAVKMHEQLLPVMDVL